MNDIDIKVTGTKQNRIEEANCETILMLNNDHRINYNDLHKESNK